MKTKLAIVLLLTIISLLATPTTAQQVRGQINFPDILGYKTLKCDLHMHTVFSDAAVWPTVRVDEALREGLDAISITDHIEYHPHKQDIPVSHNRPYQIAQPAAQKRNILLIMGAEITRDTPPGHFNAIFVQDINPLDVNDLIEAIKAANQQNAFVFWNHPGWKPEAKEWVDIHTTLCENKLLKGIEVANGDGYYPEAHRWCLEKNLTMMGNSDIHGPAENQRTMPDKHRTMTLVFAKDKTIDAIKEALLAGRTAVWFQNQLIGSKKYLEAIFKAAVQIKQPTFRHEGKAWFEITNNSAIDIELQRTGRKGPPSLTLPANDTITVKVKTKNGQRKVNLPYLATNFLIAPGEGLPVDLTILLRGASNAN
jgi:hypothetical protein